MPTTKKWQSTFHKKPLTSSKIATPSTTPTLTGAITTEDILVFLPSAIKLVSQCQKNWKKSSSSSCLTFQRFAKDLKKTNKMKSLKNSMKWASNMPSLNSAFLTSVIANKTKSNYGASLLTIIKEIKLLKPCTPTCLACKYAPSRTSTHTLKKLKPSMRSSLSIWLLIQLVKKLNSMRST